MKKTTLILSLVLISATTLLAAPAAMKIKIIDAETLYKATVTAEQMTNNTNTLHIFNGEAVSRDVAKDAFLKGETSCRVFLDGTSEPFKSQSVMDLAMELPSQNRKMLAFLAADEKSMFALTCQASSAEITRESVLKALGSLVEVVK